MKESRLEDIRVYLSGPCENLKDSGASWRSTITPKLKKLGCLVFDPVVKNGITLSFVDNPVEEFAYVKKLRSEGKFEELSKCSKEVVRTDLRLCDCADIIIVQWDADVITVGTVDEIVTSANQKKPVYLCCKQGKKKIPIWLWGRIPTHYIFDSLDDIIKRLEDIAYCNKKDLPNLIDKRWLFSSELGV